MKHVVKFLFAMSFSWSVNAQDYVEIVNAGASYSTTYFTTGYGKKYLSSERRDELSAKEDDFYHIAVGHIGKLVYEFSVDDKKMTVLDVDGNYVIVNQKGYKPSTKSNYLSFLNELNKPREFFGLQLGMDTYNDVIKKLEKSNIKYEIKWYTGSPERPILYVYGAPNAPVINDANVNYHRLQFINDKLYSIEFWWDIPSKKQHFEIYKSLLKGLEYKYLSDHSEKNHYAMKSDHIQTSKDTRHNLNYLWINNALHITVETWSERPYIKLTYNATDLFKNAAKLDEQLLAESEKREKANEAKKNSSNL